MNSLASTVRGADLDTIDISQLQSVALTLGPYRNLTTLTASILFLHPECQVLNHGGPQILGSEELDFFRNYSDERFARFVRFAVLASQSGDRGGQGGSIALSHAFDAGYEVKKMFEERFGDIRVKPVIRTLMWKESLIVANHLRKHGIDVSGVLKANDRLRFLIPVRNPLDCAASSLKGKFRLFVGHPEQPSIEWMLEAILDEFEWCLQWRHKQPERFLVFFEHGLDPHFLRNLAAFLKLPCDEQWLKQATAALRINQNYQHPPKLVAFYREAVQRRFSTYPEFAAELLKFNA